MRPLADTARRHGLVLSCVALVVLPFVVAVGRAASDGWLPVNDNALTAVRSVDVGTSHHPLLGLWSSASVALGFDVNHPGPLMFDLYALPAKVDPHAGVAVGVAAVNVLAVIGIAAFAWRAGGRAGLLAAMAGTAGLAWAVGSELLFDPWQPHAVLFPFLLVLVLGWAAAAGDLGAAPWLAGVASLVVQTHVSYMILVPMVTLVGIVGLAAALRARWTESDDHAELRRRIRRTAVAVVVVLAACWLQPLVEQLREGRDGNVVRLIDSATEHGTVVGPALGTRIVAQVLTLPPWWARPSFSETLRYDDPKILPPDYRATFDLPSLAGAVAALVVLGAALAAVGVVARRRHDRAVGAALAVAATAIAAGLLTAWRLPTGPLPVASHHLRWLWPIGVFVTIAGLTALARWVRASQLVSGSLLALTAVLAVLSLPKHTAGSGPVEDADAIPVVTRLIGQLEEVEDAGTVLFDTENLLFAEPYSASIMAELQRRGVEFTVPSVRWSRQVGSERLSDGGEDSRLFLVEGEDARHDVPGADRIAFASALTDSQLRELDALESEVAVAITNQGLPLTPAGRRLAESGGLPLVPDDGTAYRDGPALVESGLLGAYVDDALVSVPEELTDTVDRYIEERRLLDRRTVAVYLDTSYADG